MEFASQGWHSRSRHGMVLSVTVDELKIRMVPLLVAKGARRIILFGSVARGSDDARSDLDLIIVDDEDLPYLKRIDKYYDDLVELLHRPVDLFVYREAEFAAMRDQPFVRGALREGTVLHE